MEIRTAYGPRYRVQINFPFPSLTQQNFQAECNISTIMARFEKDGILTHYNTHKGQYGEFADVQDFQTSVNQVMAAESAFMTLPARVRSTFDNDPAKFLAFATNPQNAEKMTELGLIKPSQNAPEAPPEPLSGEAIVTAARETLAAHEASEALKPTA